MELDPVGDTDFARLSRLVLTGSLPPGAREVAFSFDPAFGPSVIRVPDNQGGHSYSAYLGDGSPSAPIPVEGGLSMSAGQVFLDYIGIGFTHIVPKGLDHILFVVGLFLLSPRLKPLLIQITSFTIAHSVTLALAMMGLISAPASIVEPLIAASIVFIAVENLATNRLSPWRPFVVFGFGLLHGLGFAGVLTEFGLSPAHFASGLDRVQHWCGSRATGRGGRLLCSVRRLVLGEELVPGARDNADVAGHRLRGRVVVCRAHGARCLTKNSDAMARFGAPSMKRRI